jgi:hypothetical protein
VHTEALAGAAPEQLAVDRPGAAAIDAFLVLGPQINALDARIALTIRSVSSPAWCVTTSMVT